MIERRLAELERLEAKNKGRIPRQVTPNDRMYIHRSIMKSFQF